METQIYCAHDEIAQVDSLVENPRNPNKHPQKQLEMLAKIIKNQGWRNPITVSNRSGFIIKGHGRLQAAKLAGLSVVPVDRQDYENEAAEWADMVADNRLAELAELDDALLKDVLQELETHELDMELAGFDDKSFAELMGRISTGGAKEDDFDAEGEAASIVDPITQPGDLWQLGKHRLICGDSTHIEDLEMLAGGNLVDMLWTDPPYGVAYVGGTKDHLTIKNDNLDKDELLGFLALAFLCANKIMKPGAPFYIAHPAGPLSVQFGQAVLAVSWNYHETLVWLKDSLVLGHSDYHYKHEPIIYGWKPGAGRPWYSDRKQTSVLEIERPKRSKEHPTMKPIALVANHMQNSSKGSDIVLDIFGGSGTTLIAAEQLGRNAYLCELDPIYCDVIIKRWETLTGGKAELIGGE